MARPSKLTDKQWADIEKRALDGEPVRALAREYGVTESPIRLRVKTHARPLKEIAKQLATAEMAVEALPVITQVKVRSLADELKDISHHLAGAARLGAETSHLLAGIANAHAQLIDPINPFADDGEVMKNVVMTTKAANLASEIPLNLLAANKEQTKNLHDIDTEKTKTLSDFYGELASNA
jgi:transposase-like protein